MSTKLKRSLKIYIQMIKKLINKKKIILRRKINYINNIYKNKNKLTSKVIKTMEELVAIVVVNNNKKGILNQTSQKMIDPFQF